MDVDVDTYRALVIASALHLYATTGMLANNAYTPKNMIRAASEITGKTFKPRAYIEAANALRTTIGLEPYAEVTKK